MGLGGRAVTLEAQLDDRRGTWTGTLPESGTVEVRLDRRVERTPGVASPGR
jgi:hypothetical protein